MVLSAFAHLRDITNPFAMVLVWKSQSVSKVVVMLMRVASKMSDVLDSELDGFGE